MWFEVRRSRFWRTSLANLSVSQEWLGMLTGDVRRCQVGGQRNAPRSLANDRRGTQRPATPVSVTSTSTFVPPLPSPAPSSHPGASTATAQFPWPGSFEVAFFNCILIFRASSDCSAGTKLHSGGGGSRPHDVTKHPGTRTRQPGVSSPPRMRPGARHEPHRPPRLPRMAICARSASRHAHAGGRRVLPTRPRRRKAGVLRVLNIEY